LESHLGDTQKALVKKGNEEELKLEDVENNTKALTKNKKKPKTAGRADKSKSPDNVKKNKTQRDGAKSKAKNKLPVEQP